MGLVDKYLYLKRGSKSRQIQRISYGRLIFAFTMVVFLVIGAIITLLRPELNKYLLVYIFGLIIICYGIPPLATGEEIIVRTFWMSYYKGALVRVYGFTIIMIGLSLILLGNYLIY